MRKVIVRQDHNNYPTTEIKADKPMNSRPTILKTFYSDEVRMYAGMDGKTYIADKFDLFFNPGIKLSVLPEKRNVKKLRV